MKDKESFYEFFDQYQSRRTSYFADKGKENKLDDFNDKLNKIREYNKFLIWKCKKNSENSETQDNEVNITLTAAVK